MGVVNGKANATVGEVEFAIAERTYVARLGDRELIILEKLWGVEGLDAIFKCGIAQSNERFNQFAKVALSRYQPELSPEDLSDLIDYRDENETRTAVDGIIAAFEAACPKRKTATEATTAPIAAGPKEVKSARSR